MIKNALVFMAGLLVFHIVAAQRIVKNIIFFDLDDSYNVIDSVMSKNGLRSTVCYQCKTGSFNKDSCVLKSKKLYDENGRLIEFEKNCSANQNCISAETGFKKVSDTIYEAITMYPLQSDEIPDAYYLDTVIKGKARRLPLYKKDKDNKLYVRSIYVLDSGRNLLVVKRYDLNGKLVQLFYPFGDRNDWKEFTETKVSEFDSVVTIKTRFNESKSENLTRLVYSKKGSLCERIDESESYDRSRKSISKIHFYYNSANQLIRKVTVGENNQLVSEELFYYEMGRLIKYTEDDNFDDAVLREERIYDKSGRMVLCKNYNKYNGNSFAFEYIYNDKNLLEKEIYYLDNKHEYTRFYIYN